MITAVLGASTLTRVVFALGMLIIVGELAAALFTIVYRRVVYKRRRVHNEPFGLALFLCGSLVFSITTYMLPSDDADDIICSAAVRAAYIADDTATPVETSESTRGTRPVWKRNTCVTVDVTDPPDVWEAGLWALDDNPPEPTPHSPCSP